MTEFLGYSIDFVADTLHMPPKTIQHYVCQNALILRRKFCKTKKWFHYTPARGICNHGSSMFIKRILIILCPRLLFGIVACTFVLFSDNLS